MSAFFVDAAQVHVSMPIKGLDQLTRKLRELAEASAALDGNIASVSFDPEDPQSIENAIQQMEASIDQRVGRYLGNEMVGDLVRETKERFRQAISDRAAAVRADGESNIDDQDRSARAE